MAVSFQVSKEALASCRKQVEAQLAELVADVTANIYNKIVLNDRPYWSGQYLASWDVSLGSPSYKNLTPAKYAAGGGASIHYPRSKPLALIKAASPYTPWYITNDAQHAMKVEYEGTPTHAGGWHIAVDAKNRVVGNYRFY